MLKETRKLLKCLLEKTDLERVTWMPLSGAFYCHVSALKRGVIKVLVANDGTFEVSRIIETNSMVIDKPGEGQKIGLSKYQEEQDRTLVKSIFTAARKALIEDYARDVEAVLDRYSP